MEAGTEEGGFPKRTRKNRSQATALPDRHGACSGAHDWARRGDHTLRGFRDLQFQPVLPIRQRRVHRPVGAPGHPNEH